MTTITTHDRADTYNKTHLQIRQLLDADNLLDGFVLIDSSTLASQAVWRIESTESCNLDTEGAIEAGRPLIMYPGEDFTLWQVRLVTQDLPTS